MADWDAIIRNARRSGGFAGRSPAEEDAYFAFFAGDGRATAKTRRAASRAWDFLRRHAPLLLASVTKPRPKDRRAL